MALQASHVIMIIGIKRLQQGDQMIAQVANKTVRKRCLSLILDGTACTASRASASAPGQLVSWWNPPGGGRRPVSRRRTLGWVISVDKFPAARAGSECSHVSPVTIRGLWKVTADADPHSCRPRGHTAHHHKDPRRETQKINHTTGKAAGADGLCSVPSTCKRSGQLAPPVRQRAAC